MNQRLLSKGALLLLTLILGLFFSACSKPDEKIDLASFSVLPYSSESEPIAPYRKINLEYSDQEEHYPFAYLDGKVFSSYFGNGRLTIASLDVKTKEVEVIYVLPDVYSLNNLQIVKGKIYLNAYTTNRMGKHPFIGHVVEITLKGESRVLFEEPCIGLGQFSQVNDQLVLVWSNSEQTGTRDHVTLFDLKNGQGETLANAYFETTEGTRIKGERIFYCGGQGDYLYYQRMAYQDEDMLDEGENHIIQLNLKTRKEKILDYPQLNHYIAGNKDLIILSQYDGKAFVEHTGFIYDLQAKEAIPIPYVSSSTFLLDTRWVKDDQVLLESMGETVLFDQTKRKFYTFDDLRWRTFGQSENGHVVGIAQDLKSINFYILP